jgi:hypothetical protein
VGLEGSQVPSFRPKDPNAKDMSTLAHSRRISNLNRLHHEWATYRLDVLAQRFAMKKDGIKARYEERTEELPELWANPTFDRARFVEWAHEQIAYLKVSVFNIRQRDLRIWTNCRSSRSSRSSCRKGS